jgi:hypothetical protein
MPWGLTEASRVAEVLVTAETLTLLSSGGAATALWTPNVKAHIATNAK